MQRILLIFAVLLSANAYAADLQDISGYVSRVGKLIQIVSDRPDLNYQFVVTEDPNPSLTLDREQGLISLSHGLLLQLHDEAELAAVLSLAIGRLADYLQLDREASKYLSFAGYDPQALLEIQEQYFHAAHAGFQHWLTAIYPAPPSAGTITANRVMIKKLPKGLQRGTENYQQAINN